MRNGTDHFMPKIDIGYFTQASYKKVADKLVELSKKDKKNYESYWKNIHPFIKYGMMNDDGFYEKTKDICLFKSAKGLYTTIPEYLEANKEKAKKQQRKKTKRIVERVY